MIDRFRTPLALALAAGLSITLFAGCSSSDSKDSADSTTTTAAAANGGSGDSATSDSVDDSSSGSTGATDICTGIDATQVGLILSATVTKEDVPGGGCNFAQDDPRAASIAFASVESTSDSDFDVAKSASISAAGMTGATETDPGIGAKSVIATGTANGGENTRGIGIMQDGDTIVTVILLQGTGMDATAVEAAVNQALSLAEQDI